MNWNIAVIVVLGSVSCGMLSDTVSGKYYGRSYSRSPRAYERSSSYSSTYRSPSGYKTSKYGHSLIGRNKYGHESAHHSYYQSKIRYNGGRNKPRHVKFVQPKITAQQDFNPTFTSKQSRIIKNIPSRQSPKTIKQTPVPVKQAPAPPPPVRQAPVKQAPAPPTPVRQTPVKQAPAPAPVRQAPVKKTAAPRKQVPVTKRPAPSPAPRPAQLDAKPSFPTRINIDDIQTNIIKTDPAPAVRQPPPQPQLPAAVGVVVQQEVLAPIPAVPNKPVVPIDKSASFAPRVVASSPVSSESILPNMILMAIPAVPDLPVA